MSVLEKLAELKAIYADADAKAAPLIAELGPYVEAAAEAKRLGLGPNSTASEITKAFAGAVNANPRVQAIIPTLLDADAAERTKALAQEVLDVYKTNGSSLGAIVGGLVGAAM